MTQGNYTGTTPSVGVTTAVVTPFDRVRWGPILAGLFAALSTLTLLSVLGLAIGLTAWDRGDNTRAYSIGAGIWSIITALISFFVGGWLAARSAAAAGERNGVLNGSMVWAVAIPLMLFAVGGGFAALADAAVNGRGTRVVMMERGDTADRAQTASARLGDTVSGTMGGNTTDAATTQRHAAVGAWWTLISLVLGLCAAAAGGASGAARTWDRNDTTRTTPPAPEPPRF